MSRSITISVVLLAAAQFAGAGVLNPSFEDSPAGLYVGWLGVPGWLVNGEVEVVDIWEAADGNQSLDLNGSWPGAIYQDLPTTAGDWYRLRFAMAGNPVNGGVRDMQMVWVSGGITLSEVLSFDTTGKTFENMGWIYHSYLVQAGSDTATLWFVSQVEDCYGPALDDVSLVPSCITGDLNCDGSVNFGDINPFVLALTNWGEYLQQYPDCDIYCADINADSYVTFADINPFVALLTGR